MARRMDDAPAGLIRAWLGRQIPDDAARWLDAQIERLSRAASSRALYVALGTAPRRLGKADLVLSEDDLAAARRARSGWDPIAWSVDEAARILILLAAGRAGPAFAATFGELCRTAEVGELIAFYRGLPLYPDQDRLVRQAGEGLRTNMRAVFEAVAHRNPFPREQFDQDRWNQMVLKALFIESPLHPIQGLDRRSNPELARMMCDYARERWAAGRAVSPELWRCVGPHADAAMLEDLRKVLADGTGIERKAASLALASSPAAEASRLLAGHRRLAELIEQGRLTWDGLVHEMASGTPAASHASREL